MPWAKKANAASNTHEDTDHVDDHDEASTSRSSGSGYSGTKRTIATANRLVSSSLLSRSEKQLVSDLIVKLKAPSQHGNSKSSCWKHIGYLYSSSRNVCLDADKYYCMPCLEHQKAAGDKGHLSNVVCFSASTSTGTMSLHLSVKHNINEGAAAVEKLTKISSYLQKYALPNDKASVSIIAHEFNRDITVWFCRDLLPFDAIAKEGMADFFRKLFPDI